MVTVTSVEICSNGTVIIVITIDLNTYEMSYFFSFSLSHTHGCHPESVSLIAAVLLHERFYVLKRERGEKNSYHHLMYLGYDLYDYCS